MGELSGSLRASTPVTAPTAAPRRAGRPQRLPVDTTPVDGTEIDGPRRMAWLLATSRLLAPSTSALRRGDFLERLQAQGVSLDASRLSRLESGAARSPLPVLTAYEELTGSGRGVLAAVESLVARTRGDQPAVRQVELDPRALDRLVEQATTGRAVGGDWIDLAAGLVGFHRVYMHGPTWAAVSTRLLSELTRATGTAYVTRYEAAVMLLAHEQVRGHLTQSLGQFVMDPDVQSVSPSLTLLGQVGDDAATRLVLRLTGPGTSSALLRRGAASVALTLGSRGALSQAQLTVLEQVLVRETARDGPVPDRLDVVELAAVLPGDSFARVLASTRDPVLRRAALLVRRQHELVEPDVARSVSETVAGQAEGLVGHHHHEPDQMLARLLREALFHHRRERRHLAGVVLGASRYAPAVATATSALLSSDDEVLAATSWLLLRRLGHLVPRADLAPLVLAEERPGLRPTALLTLGLGGGALPDPVADELADLATHHEPDPVRHAATFALGLAGHPALRRLAEVEVSRRAALWWLTAGPAVTDAHAG